MGIDISDVVLTPEEMVRNQVLFRQHFDEVVQGMIGSSNGTLKDKRLFGIEVESFIVGPTAHPIPDGASALIQRYDWVVPEVVNFQAEMNRPPFPVSDGNMVHCLEDLFLRESQIAESVGSSVDGTNLKVGMIPRIPNPGVIRESFVDKPRYRLIHEYVRCHMDGSPLSITYRDGSVKQLGNDMGSGLINGTHINIQGLGDKDSAMLFNVANALSAPLVALSANSSVSNGKINSHLEERIFLFEKKIEVTDSDVPRVGTFPGYIDTLGEYFRSLLDFNPIFPFNEKNPENSYQNNFSIYWPWVKAHANGFQRIELRSVSRQPTLWEDLAVTTLYVYAALGIKEKLEQRARKEGKSISSAANDYLAPQEALTSNLHAAATSGYDAQLRWRYGIQGERASAQQVLHVLHTEAKEYMDRNEIDKSAYELLEIAKRRIDKKLNPAVVLARSVETMGFDPAIRAYMKHTNERKQTPFAA